MSCLIRNSDTVNVKKKNKPILDFELCTVFEKKNQIFLKMVINKQQNFHTTNKFFPMCKNM